MYKLFISNGGGGAQNTSVRTSFRRCKFCRSLGRPCVMARKTRPGWKSGKGAPNDNNDTIPLTTRREWKHEISTDSHHLTTKNDNHNTSTTIAINNNQPYIKKNIPFVVVLMYWLGLFLEVDGCWFLLLRAVKWVEFISGDIFFTTLAFE